MQKGHSMMSGAPWLAGRPAVGHYPMPTSSAFGVAGTVVLTVSTDLAGICFSS